MVNHEAECALCRALTLEAERVVYRDDLAFVLLNFEPLKPGHLMVLPVRHVQDMGELNPEEAQAFLRLADRCQEAVRKMQHEETIFFVNGWEHRSQAHLHGHILPSKHNLRGLFVAAEGVAPRSRADVEALNQAAEEMRKVF